MKPNRRLYRFAKDAFPHTPILKMTFLLVGLWFVFAADCIFPSGAGRERRLCRMATPFQSHCEELAWNFISR